VEHVRVTVEKQPKSSVTLDIAADQDEFDKALDRAFRRINQLVNIPGFRPGKAPRRLVEQRIGRDLIVQEAHRDIMDKLYQEALEQESLVPVSDPEVDVYQDEPLAFKVQIDVYPNVDLGDYSSVRVEPREVNLEDGAVDEAVEDLRTAHSTWTEPESPGKPEDGDQVILDLEVFEDGAPFHDPVRDADFVLGEGPLFTQIAEAVKQLSPGETAEFDITFGEDDEDVPEDIRGKTLSYKVTLHEYKVREMPEVNDEFATDVIGLESVDEMRAALRRDLLGAKVQEARDEVIDETFEKFAEIAELEIPDSMIDTELEREVEQLGQRLGRDGMSIDEYLRFSDQTVDDLKIEMRPNVERRVRNAVILEAFVEAEKIDVEAEIEEEIERMAARSEQPEQMRQIYQSEYFRSMIHNQLQSQRVTERMIEIVTEGVGAITGEGAEYLEEARQRSIAETAEIFGGDDEDAYDDLEEDDEDVEDDDSDDDDADDELDDEDDADDPDDDDRSSSDTDDDDEERSAVVAGQVESDEDADEDEKPS
jgi:trigger factor